MFEGRIAQMDLNSSSVTYTLLLWYNPQEIGNIFIRVKLFTVLLNSKRNTNVKIDKGLTPGNRRTENSKETDMLGVVLQVYH